MAKKDTKAKAADQSQEVRESAGKGMHLHLSTGVVAIGLTLLGLGLFLMSYKTGYYVYGQMKSPHITGAICAAIFFELILVLRHRKGHESLFVQLLPLFITALLGFAAMMIIGDRVEGIGNCIITDYDSGHGGEEAIYMSLVGSICLLAAMIYTIIGSFARGGTAPAKRGKSMAIILSGSFLAIISLTATMMLTGVFDKKEASGGAGAVGKAGTYTLSLSQNNGNVDEDAMPDYQFLSANMGGLCRADARFYIDIALTLDGKGGYSLTSDSYVFDSGKRVGLGDPSGLGLTYKTTSEGSYTDNGDGTVTTSAADHVKFELATDTYSEQMKSMMHIDLDGSDADGEYDSADYPVLLDYVPGTVWTLEGDKVVTYAKPSLKGDFSISFNQNNGNTDADVMPEHQFLSANMGGLCRADARFYIDVALSLDGQGSYSLVSDAYVLESGKRAEIGDPSGLGLIYRTTSEGTYEENEDGTVTTAAADHVKFELGTDTYSEQMKSMMHIDLDGSDADGEYDSADYPVLLDYIPETIWTLDRVSSAVVSYEAVEEEEQSEEAAVDTQEAEGSGEDAGEAPLSGLTVSSDDGATTLTFQGDGTYVFAFESYGVSDPGSWSLEDGKLTLVNANEAAFEAEGDPFKLSYVSAVSEQLGGQFTVNASELASLAAGGAQEVKEEAGAEEASAEASAEEVPAEASAGAEGVTIISDDGATTLTFQGDGTYVFAFESYGVSDPGSWSLEDGKLTLVNANEAAFEAEGDPFKLSYVSAVSEQLGGQFTVNAAELASLAAGGTQEVKEEAGAEEAPAEASAEEVPAEASAEEVPAEASAGAEGVTITSEDGATALTFQGDGTYVFAFESYGVSDPGSWSLEDGKLTLVNANEAAFEAEGDPFKLHYVSAVSDQLSGDFTIPAKDLGA